MRAQSIVETSRRANDDRRAVVPRAVVPSVSHIRPKRLDGPRGCGDDDDDDDDDEDDGEDAMT